MYQVENNLHRALWSVLSFSPPETGKGQKHASRTPGRAGCALGGTHAPEDLAGLISWAGVCSGLRPTLMPLFTRLPGYSSHCKVCLSCLFNREARHDCSRGCDGGTRSTKRASLLRRQSQTLEDLECHANEFGHGLRVRSAKTRSEPCLKKIIEADGCAEWIPGR